MSKTSKRKMKAVAMAAVAVKPLEDFTREFAVLMDTVKNSVKAMATTYVEAIRVHGAEEAQKAFAARFPAVRNVTWDTLRHIGNGDLPEQAVLFSDAMKSRLLAMPPSRRDVITLAGKGFNVVDVDTGVVRFVRYEDITERQAAVLFDGSDVRDETKQREYIAAHAEELSAHTSKPPFRIDGQKLVVGRRCSIGKAELKAILQNMGD